MEAASPPQPPEDVLSRRRENCKIEYQIKIAFSLGGKAKEYQLLASFRATGAAITEGSAPTEYMEEEIPTWADALKGAEPNQTPRPRSRS